MQNVTLIQNPLDPASWERDLQVEDVREFLIERLGSWPSSARIYDGPPAIDRDVTPANDDEVEALVDFEDLTVVVYPGDPITAVIAIGAVLLGVAAAMFLRPSVPSLDNRQAASPNNGLSTRTNKPRPLGRIPDIFGEVRSTPDLIAQPYRVYENHREVEIAYMCVGRGSYDIEDIRDGDTLIQNIEGASAEVWGPYSSPNDGTPRQVLVGSPIGDPVFDVVRLNEVNGQVMRADNDTAVRARSEIRFRDGGIVEASGGRIDFTEYFQPGDFIDIGRASDPGGVTGFEAVQAAVIAGGGGFDFPTFDPTTRFAVGQFVSVTGAVWQIDDGGNAGAIVGGTDYPSYPSDPWAPIGIRRELDS
jgi:hypothetical protein